MSLLSAPDVPKPTPNIPDSVFEQFKLKGRVAIITGGAAGIGYAVADAYAEAGADVALWYNSNKAAIEKGEALAKKHGVKVKAYQCGVTDMDKVYETVQQVKKDFGRIDIFVANAGCGYAGGVTEQSIDDWKRVVDTNYNSVYYCARAVGPIFKEQGRGNLIITASMSGRIVNVPIDQGCYNSTKAAVIHLGRSLAREWRDFARVNAVSPGFFETDMGAAPNVLAEAYRMAVMGRQGDVKEIKGIYLFLASDASTYVTGSDFLIDGGYCIP